MALEDVHYIVIYLTLIDALHSTNPLLFPNDPRATSTTKRWRYLNIQLWGRDCAFIVLGSTKNLAVAASSRCLFNEGESMLSGLNLPSIGSGCALCHCQPIFCSAKATKVLLMSWPWPGRRVRWHGRRVWLSGMMVGTEAGYHWTITEQAISSSLPDSPADGPGLIFLINEISCTLQRTVKSHPPYQLTTSMERKSCQSSIIRYVLI